jgi:hypothetical protein
MGLEFYEFRSLFTYAKDQHHELRKRDPVDFYEELIRGDGITVDMGYHASENSQNLVFMMERDLYKWTRPYYKIYPSLLKPLTELKMEVPPSYITLPYPTIEMRYYKGSGELYFGEEIQTILATIKNANELSFDYPIDGIDKVILLVTRTKNRTGFSFIHLEKDTNVEDSLYISEEFFKRANPDQDFKQVERIIRTVVGTSFFSMDSHELIMPDLPRKVIQRYNELKSPLEKEQLLKREQKKTIGHRVGREIDLPRPLYENLGQTQTTSNPTESHQRTYSHVRSGHLRLQRYGPKDTPTYQTIFIAPTVVRPDLPMSTTPSKGHRVRSQ